MRRRTTGAATICALAIGVSIFNFIYWNCSFVLTNMRMGIFMENIIIKN